VTDKMLDYQMKMPLKNGGTLTTLVFEHEPQVTWTFQYRYRLTDPESLGQARMVNDLRFVFAYVEGVIKGDLTLSMHVVIPERLGKKYVAGCDISPGAKTFIQFHYRPEDEGYRLYKIEVGARKVLNLDELDPNVPVKPMDFPFPVPDRIERAFEGEVGPFVLPFLASDGETREFHFDDSILRYPPKED